MHDACAHAGEWIPRGECGPWTPFLATLYIAGDLATFAAYLALAGILRSRSRRRLEQPARADAVLVSRAFAAFLIACAVDHLEGVVSFFLPHYPTFAVVNVVVAVVSWAAVLVLYHLRSKALVALS